MEVMSYISHHQLNSPSPRNKLFGGKNGEIIGTKLTDFNTEEIGMVAIHPFTKPRVMTRKLCRLQIFESPQFMEPAI